MKLIQPTGRRNSGMWDKSQIRMFVREVRKDAGDGWYWLVPKVRKALIAERAFAVIRGQAAESVRVEAMDELYLAMMAEAGLDEV
jgi:hypothetical protein